MKFLYGLWDFDKEHLEERIKQLLELFNLLLNKTAGDVNQALEWLDQVAEKYGLWGDGLDLETFKAMLQKDGQIREGDQGGMQLTPKGEKTLRKEALNEIFGDLLKAGPGEHRSRVIGAGGERQTSTRPYEFGDDLWSISPTDTLNNAVHRTMSGGGDEITLQEEDFAVYENEMTTSCATALLVDCSHSMVLYGEDRMTPARKVALGLVELIKTKYPRDRLHVIAFGDDAVEIPLEKVPYLTWGRFHTNTKAALEMARKILLRSRSTNRQIFMVTDGKPTVLDEGGKRYIDSGWMNPRIINRTLEEAAMCRRKDITITTFMVADDPYLVSFVEDLTKINKGRAYYTSLGKLGQFLFVDYIKNRRRTMR